MHGMDTHPHETASTRVLQSVPQAPNRSHAIGSGELQVRMPIRLADGNHSKTSTLLCPIGIERKAVRAQRLHSGFHLTPHSILVF